MKIYKALLLSLFFGEGVAFSQNGLKKIESSSSMKMSKGSEDMPSSTNNSRREFVRNSLILLSSSSIALPAFADVSDGNALPSGAAQFGRIVRAKTDLEGVQKRVQQSADEMDKTEWNNVGAFLRRVYAVSDDMKAVASGFYDPAKKKRAGELIEDLKKVSKAADAPTGKQSGPEFLPYAKKMISILDEYLDLLSDVPDEL